MSRADNIYSNDRNVTGVNRLRATAPVRRFMRRDLVLSSNLVAAVLVAGESSSSNSGFPCVCLGQLSALVKEVVSLGIPAMKLFVHGQVKDAKASTAADLNSPAFEAIKRVKDAAPDLCVITDTCLCASTDSGNCVLTSRSGEVDLESTTDQLTRIALLQVEAGADIVGPAPMADGVVASLRKALDRHASRPVPLMPNLTWRSCLYRTYRSVMGTGSGHQRQAFQIDPSCPQQYLAMGRDMSREGADMLMLQPSLFSLDLIGPMKARTSLPVGVYSVSGEYMMFKELAADEEAFFDLVFEHATACRRAGADFVITYAWRELVEGRLRFMK